MKNSAVRLIAALTTFAVGVALVTLWLAYHDSGHARRSKAPCRRGAPAPTLPLLPAPAAPPAESPGGEGQSPILSYCELVDDHERYDGKVVRVRATVRMSIHGLFLTDAACGLDEDYAAVAFDERRGQELVDTFFGADSPMRVGPGVVELIAVGRFRKVVPSGTSDSLLDTTPLRFEMMHVERIHVGREVVTAGQKARKVAR